MIQVGSLVSLPELIMSACIEAESIPVYNNVRIFNTSKTSLAFSDNAQFDLTSYLNSNYFNVPIGLRQKITVDILSNLVTERAVKTLKHGLDYKYSLMWYDAGDFDSYNDTMLCELDGGANIVDINTSLQPEIVHTNISTNQIAIVVNASLGYYDDYMLTSMDNITIATLEGDISNISFEENSTKEELI
jgi:hypothetical protein